MIFRSWVVSQRWQPLAQIRLPILQTRSAVRNVSTSFSKPEPAPLRGHGSHISLLSGQSELVLLHTFSYTSESRSAPTYDTRPLSPLYFTPTTLTSSEPSGPDTKLLTLTISPDLLPPRDDPSIFATIWSVFIKDNDIQVERPYTPLEGVDEHGRMLFWIKMYEKGEVGRWLHSKKVGDSVEIRGPLKTWTWQDDVWDDVILVCCRLLS